MTVLTLTSEVVFTGNGSSTEFPFAFQVPDEDSIVVFLQASENAPYVDVTSGCSFTGIGEASGGTVTYPLVGDPIDSPQRLTIVREVPNTQEITVTNQTRYDANVAMRVWDRLTMQIQQLQQALLRTPRFLLGADVDQVYIEDLTDGQTLMWDEVNSRITAGPEADDIAGAQQAALDAQAARDLAQQYAEDAAEAAAGVGVVITSFSSRASAEAATIDPSIFRITVEHDGEVLQYLYDAAGTALMTNGGDTWSPAGVAATPAHWGAVSLVDVDQASYIQACFDYVKGSRDSSIEQFAYHFDGLNKTYVVKTSLNFGGVRQPDLMVRNLMVFGEGSGIIVLDATDSNQIVWENVVVVGKETNPPASGFHLGRRSTGAIAPNHKMLHCRTKGSFTVAGIVNNASEAWTCTACYWENKHQAITAYALVIVGNNTILSTFFPSYASDYYTWFTGSQSCISHNLGFCQIGRPSRSTLTITGITKAANAVVTVNPADLTASHFQIGSLVYFHDLAGMTELNFTSAEITNINFGTGQITIDANTVGFGTFTSGRLWTRTGPGMLLGSCANVVMNGNYILTYGSRSVDVDLRDGNVRGIDMTFQQEASPARVVQFFVDAAHIVTDFRIKLRNISQTILTSIFNTSGSGTVEFRWLELLCSSDGDGASFGAGGTVFSPKADFKVHGGKLVIPDRLAADYEGGTTLPDDFQGTVFAYDDGQQDIIHGGLQFPPTPMLSSDNNNLDDYEEGNWTPVLRFGGAGTGIAYGTNAGRYQKIGNQVTAMFRIVLTNDGSASGAATIQGLPFNVLQAQAIGGAISTYQDMAGIAGTILIAPSPSSDDILLRDCGATAANNLTEANFTNTSILAGFVTYRTDE